MSKDKPTLPYDYARCMTKDCPRDETCMRSSKAATLAMPKTPGRETYQTIFAPVASPTCKYYISMEEWG